MSHSYYGNETLRDLDETRMDDWRMDRGLKTLAWVAMLLAVATAAVVTAAHWL